MTGLTPAGQHVEDLARLTKGELEEGLRLARLGLARHRADTAELDQRLAACDARIEEQHRLKERWEDLAEQAPERVTRALARIAALEEEQRSSARKVATPSQVRAALVERLSARIANGDMEALKELKGLLL